MDRAPGRARPRFGAGHGRQCSGADRGRIARGKCPQRLAAILHRPDCQRPGARGHVIGGLTFAYGEGGGKRTFAGLIFGIGMAVLAVNFLSWLFGV